MASSLGGDQEKRVGTRLFLEVEWKKRTNSWVHPIPMMQGLGVDFESIGLDVRT